MLKAKFALVLVIAASAGAIAAPLAQAGNWADSRLDATASQIAGKPINVWCESSWSDWIHAGDSVHENWDEVGGFTYLSEPTIYVAPDSCFTLHALLGRESVGTLYAAQAILVLAHEAVHQRGISDEGVTECTALPLVPSLAVSHFGIASTMRQTYATTVWKSVRVKVGGTTVTRKVSTRDVRSRVIPNPWLKQLAADAHRWHRTSPAEYQGNC
jgi:hypothetical protein